MPGPLPNSQPYLIQRCTIDRSKPTLRYDYMGSSEFEFGEQGESLRRLHRGDIMAMPYQVVFRELHCMVWIIGGINFPFAQYVPAVEGLAAESWRTLEPTYLPEMLERHLGIPPARDTSHLNVEVWFDFRNDVLFTLTQEHAQLVIASVIQVKEAWRKQQEWLDSPPVREFRDKLDALKLRLHAAGKRWFALDTVRDIDGTLRVWLNPYERHHHFGWLTLQDLEDWLNDTGVVVDHRT